MNNPPTTVYIPQTSVVYQPTVPNGNVTSLAKKVLFIQGGSQNSAFCLAVKSALLGAKVYAASRTLYWFDFAVECYNSGLFGQNSYFVDASGTFVQAIVGGSGTIADPRKLTFPGTVGSITWLQTDCRVPYVAYIDPTPTAHAGYVPPYDASGSHPWLSEQLWFTVDTSGGQNFGKAPALSARGALSYVMQHEGYISECMIIGGTANVPPNTGDSVLAIALGAGESINTQSLATLALGTDYCLNANLYNQLVMSPDHTPTGTIKQTLSAGAAFSDQQMASQTGLRSVMTNEVFKAVICNYDTSLNRIPCRIGHFASNSGKSEFDGEGDGIRQSTYNLTHKFTMQLTKQIAVQGAQFGLTSFMGGIGGLYSKSIGFPFFHIRTAWAYSKAIDADVYDASGIVLVIEPPVDHVHKLNSINQAVPYGGSGFNQHYLNLHTAVRFEPISQRWQVRNYVNTTGLSNSAYIDDPSASWLDMINLCKTTRVNLMHSGVFANPDIMNGITVPGIIVNIPGVRNVLPLGFTLNNLKKLWYLNIFQSGGPLAKDGTMSPYDVGSCLFGLLYNNAPVTTGEYIDIDGSQYTGALGVTTHPISRFNNYGSAGSLPGSLPSTATNEGLLTQAEWANTFAKFVGNSGTYTAAQGTAYFQNPSKNLYNKGGLCPPFGL